MSAYSEFVAGIDKNVLRREISEKLPPKEKYNEGDEEGAATLFVSLADRSNQSLPQLSYHTLLPPSRFKAALQILGDTDLIEKKSYPKLGQNYFTLSEKGKELKNAIGGVASAKSGGI